MNSVLVATLGGINALILWGVSDWFTSKSSRLFSSRDVNLTMQLSGGLIMLIVFLISGKPVPELSHTIVLMSAALCFTIAYLSFIKGLSFGDVGVVVPLGNTYPLFTIVLSAIFLTVALTSLQISAILIVVCGAILLGIEKIDRHSLRKNIDKEVPLALLAAVFWGIGFFIVNAVIDKYSWQSILVVLSLSMIVYGFIASLTINKKDTLKAILNIPKNKLGILAGVTLTFGSIGLYIAADKSGGIIIPIVIASGAPLVTSALAAKFDKEKLIFTKRIGAVLVVAGVILLNL